MIEVRRDLWGSSAPPPLLKQGHLQLVAQDHIQTAFGCLQGRRLHHLSGWPLLSPAKFSNYSKENFVYGVCRNRIQNHTFLKRLHYLCSKEGCLLCRDKANYFSLKEQEENGLKHLIEVTDMENCSHELPRNVFSSSCFDDLRHRSERQGSLHALRNEECFVKGGLNQGNHS